MLHGNCHVDVSGGTGFANALRRVLTSDLLQWAPHKLTIRKNTSCQTDEFLAHRIGLIPFRRIRGNETTSMTLRVTGPGTALAKDIVGPGFEAVHPQLEIMLLGEGQALDLTVHFDQQLASKHARYCRCAAVGMQRIMMESSSSSSSERHRISFHVLDPEERAQDVYEDALDALEARVDRALLQLAHQPSVPPKTMC